MHTKINIPNKMYIIKILHKVSGILYEEKNFVAQTVILFNFIIRAVVV